MPNARTTALEQKIVKLAAANSVANGFAVVGFHLAATHEADSKTVDWLQDQAPGVLGKINLEFLQYGRRDPSSTYFVTRENLLIQDHRG